MAINLTPAIRLRNAVEPLAANVYFAPEAQAAYGELGLTYIPGYFCSRSACMGQVPGEVVVAAFGVFNPDIVVAAVTEGWSKTDATSILAAREQGAVASLERLLGETATPDETARATELLRRAGAEGTLAGHPIHSGLRSLGFPGTPWGDLWRAADLVREHRGDSHVAAWVAAGVDAIAITLLTEMWAGMPVGQYVRTRGWTTEQIDSTLEMLRQDDLVTADNALTEGGMELRQGVEDVTDMAEDALLGAIGDDLDELLSIIEPWAKAIVAAGGYPADPSALNRKQ